MFHVLAMDISDRFSSSRIIDGNHWMDCSYSEVQQDEEFETQINCDGSTSIEETIDQSNQTNFVTQIRTKTLENLEESNDPLAT